DSDWAGDNAGPAVTGLVSAPSVNRSSRGYLSFFVNRRWINSRLLSWAVEEAYHGLLMTGKHPMAIINILLPPGEVDINVHPTKTEVKFRNERLVFSAVQKAVRQGIIELAPVARIEEVATAYQAPARTTQLLSASTGEGNHPTRSTPEARPTTAFSLPALRLMGQLSSSYIIAEGPDGLYLIDQHAAHERILFEKIKQQISRQETGIQGLLEPATLEVNPQQDAVLKPRYASLAEFGFSIEPFGNRTYLVRAVPALLHEKDWAGALRELLDSPSGTNPNDWRENTAISIACHSAVRAGQTLTDDAMRELLRQLEQVALPNTCPHGRPTMIHLTSGQLEKEFGRT
ncbi:MAG: DNA mismatch repair protein MutL, partial [Chloroflexi bacterium]|nr:DNA mismatch repair protein MutL [Chloroflexota bacterium]